MSYTFITNCPCDFCKRNGVARWKKKKTIFRVTTDVSETYCYFEVKCIYWDAYRPVRCVWIRLSFSLLVNGNQEEFCDKECVGFWVTIVSYLYYSMFIHKSVYILACAIKLIVFVCDFSLHHEVDENCALLGYYATSNGNSLPLLTA